MPYTTLLLLHSWNRWIVLVLVIALLVAAVKGWNRATDAGALEKFSLFTIISIDVQLLLGIILLFLSPFVTAFVADPGPAMSNSVVRFWGVEHTTAMLVAVILAHVGRIRIKRAESPVKAHRRGAIYFGLSLLLMLLAVPWPFMAYGRELFRI